LIPRAAAFRDRGLASRGINLATRAVQAGAAPTLEIYRLLYPFPQEPVIRAASAPLGFDPTLIAAVIWQESRFTASARSPAGARGLMQVLPSVGATIARAEHIPSWDPVLLYQPDINVEIGVRHLGASLARGAGPERALAAYNAGQSRVTRWARKPGTDDPELFVERIPYVETRDYVRIIVGTRAVYGILYPEAVSR
jgi:soluble lytic murein transglycosylase